MQKHLVIKPLGLVARTADVLLIPAMRIISGAPREAPQKTHRWNNHHLTEEDTKGLNKEDMVFCKGRGKSPVKSSGARSHITIFGGWRPYVVIQPDNDSLFAEWHIGWIAGNIHGVSRISHRGPVRVLIGPGDVHFFGIRNSTGKQLKIVQVGEGTIGDGGKFSQTPLL